MPLEENELEQIKSSLEDGKFTENAEIKKLGELGLKIHTDNTLDSEVNNRVEEAIKPKVREIHTKYEQDIEELTGIKKTPNEKAYDYLKRAVPEYVKVNQSEEVKKLQTDIETYKQKIEEGDTEGIWKKKLEEAESKYQKELDNKENELKTTRESVSKATKKRLLSEAHSPIKGQYREDLPSYFGQTEKAILNDAYENSVVVEDEDENEILVEADRDGNPKKDNNFKFIPIEKRLTEQFKDAIKKQNKPGGSGSGGQGADPVDPSKITVDNFEMPATIKTKTDLSSHLLELGLKQGEKVFDDIYDKYQKDLKLR